ncbi:Formate-dependent nitrite reductase periplasmic cytochrome c552 subunit-like protein [Denitrovibrio acetiphilus DSM 12809]|uniref:nitrite reductase (cytochrome; ammonia-forming) n=1 Tax=Denitrovibrio acetiphilus (strain DSM 12809 / NBRC 114555 / N2460) TaxID=522772 RepID=D4H5F2_DENA2|nr:ammonia-forming cytochrome c nitrite reductase subunit c552 [Denitrovibrio acetiphilus]ADD67572.1 Formate-dependent nitrite reductase periplasmic cytochrome c552 subunit-like protein [Denitrovibrio acetiphilus DSM 12809]
MRLFKFLILAVFLFSLTACLGSGSEKSSVDDDTRVMTELTAGDDGAVSYSGSGDFFGFGIVASDAGLAGRKIYIERAESQYSVNGYKAVSDLFSIRFYKDRAADEESFDAEITIPFSASAVAAEGASPGDVNICMLLDDMVIPASAVSDGTSVTASAKIPYDLFACLKDDVAISENSTIILKGYSHKDADNDNEYLTDKNGTLLPDVIRGINHVQAGENVRLGYNKEAFGENISDAEWVLSDKPSGSAASLSADGTDRLIQPDMNGIYTVTLNLTGINGKSTAESIKLVAMNYSYRASTGTAQCLDYCHTGTFSLAQLDQYGRAKLRDIVSVWGASSHASAFSVVAGETDTSCLQCHTTGFFYADRDKNGTDDHPAVSGFDDTITNWTDPADTGDTHLRGVTCEACHGPGADASLTFAESHYSDVSLNSGVCLTCHEHENISGHFFEYSDTHDKAHTLSNGTVAKNAECFRCHTGEGMMSRIFGADLTPADVDTVTGIGCAVCHDPHGESGFSSLLRLSGSFQFETADGTYTADAGKAKLCYSCHNSDTVLPAVGTIPHNSTAEMYEGIGGYDYGNDLSDKKSWHALRGLECVDCHMQTEDGLTHNMLMTHDTDARLTTCYTSTCHTGTSPEFKNGYFEVESSMQNIRGQMDELADLINEKSGLPEGSAIRASYTADTAELTNALNRAAYNYNFILGDKGYGFHNQSYTRSLLGLSLADLGSY